MLKEIPLEKTYRLINHGPCVLITSGTDERSNIAPVAWLAPVNDEPAIIVLPLAKTHYTAELIEAHRQFAVNIPDEKLLPAILHAGKASGRNENKFKSAGLTAAPGVKIKTPHIEECIGYLECSVREQREYNGVAMFVADVVYAQAREDLFDETWITEKAKTVHHLGGGYFAQTGKRFKAK
ncbi:MAG: flavin reductase family protein [Endomicrobiales bacterium]